ncbi:Imm1 family immunity protein [Fibrella sp. WM1]|uniref:Imm1 family immunity protein n=1 Tax=Fibrella musci TaxID=3242485 RepID=UPI003521A142
MELDYDVWLANRNNSATKAISPADVNLVVERLAALNQKEYTQLVLGASDGHLLIGGGLGAYVCTYTQGEQEAYFNLINPHAPTDEEAEEVTVVTGGQAGTFPPAIVVDRSLAEQAIRYFIRHEQMDPSLIWEED